MFRDRARIEVRSGKGGDGAISFRREKGVPRGGPDGGDGGEGGSVYLVADSQKSHLGHLRKRHYWAEDGGGGEGMQRTGAKGADILIPVPPGTQVWRELSPKADLLHDLKEGEVFCLARGGRGGAGNMRYATSINQTPRFRKLGEEGEAHVLHLRLRIAAEVGLIGAPNAGKSSLLAAVTSASPEVAPYAFTTINPQIGVTATKMSVIDVPGLVEGAHQNRGLGHAFLDHVAKCETLVVVLDVTDEPEKTFGMLMRELNLYDGSLVPRVKLVVLNKCDLLDKVKKLDFGSIECIEVSALTGRGTDKIAARLANL